MLTLQQEWINWQDHRLTCKETIINIIYSRTYTQYENCCSHKRFDAIFSEFESWRFFLHMATPAPLPTPTCTPIPQSLDKKYSIKTVIVHGNIPSHRIGYYTVDRIVWRMKIQKYCAIDLNFRRIARSHSVNWLLLEKLIARIIAHRTITYSPISNLRKNTTRNKGSNADNRKRKLLSE